MDNGKLSILTIGYPHSFSRFIGFVEQMRKKYGEPFAVYPTLPDPRQVFSSHQLEMYWKGPDYRVSVYYAEDDKPEDNFNTSDLQIRYRPGLLGRNQKEE